MTLLDFAGPQCALGLHGNTHLLWKTLEPAKTDLGISVLPTSTFANNRKEFDVLLVPGGVRAADAIRDDEILNFLAEELEDLCLPNSRYRQVWRQYDGE